MKLLDDNLLEEVADGTEAFDRMDEEDKAFLKRLEKMAEEVEDEADNPK
jgi:Skp family chaperone for outer membrane proteins